MPSECETLRTQERTQGIETATLVIHLTERRAWLASWRTPSSSFALSLPQRPHMMLEGLGNDFLILGRHLVEHAGVDGPQELVAAGSTGAWAH